MAQVIDRVASSRWTWLAIGVALGLLLAGGGLTAQEAKAPSAATQETMTVYVAAHGGQELAQDANKVCKTYAPAGWVFANLESHTENGDQKGGWLTLVKPAQ